MDVEELLARAWGAVKKAGIPEPLQEFAFKEAIARLGGVSPGGARSAAPSESAPDTNGNGSDGESRSPGNVAQPDLTEPFAKFSHESGVPVEDLERVFYIVDGVPYLNGPRSRFGRNAADQAKVVAVAITAAYDFIRDETPIPDEVVRTEAARLKIDVGGNWARTMGSLNGASCIGPARQKQFKTTNSTAEALRNIVSSILGMPAE